MAQKEEIILDVKIDQGDAISELEKTKKSIVQIKQEQKELNKAYKDGNITLDEYISDSVRLEGILKKQQSTYNNVQKSVTGVKTQLDKLIDSNKKISNEFSKAAGELNVFGTNVGQLTGKLASFANPATAAVGIVGALTAAYANSTIGAKDLEFAQNQLTSALGLTTNAFAGLVSSAEDGEGVLTRVLNSLLFRISPALAVQSKIAALNLERIEDLQREQIKTQSENNERLEENQELLAEVNDSQTSYAEKIALTSRVINNFKTNQQGLTAVLQQQLDILKAQQAQDPNNERLQEAVLLKEKELSLVDRDAAKKINNIIKLESNLLDIENKRLEALAKRNAIEKEQAARRQAALDRGNQAGFGDLTSASTSGLLPEDDLVLNSKKRLAQDIKAINEDLQADQAAYRDAYILSERQKFEASEQLTAALAGLFQQGSEAQKAFALTSIGIDTAEAISSLTAASEANPANALTFGAAGTAQFIAGLVRILTNIASAKNILSAAAGGGDFVTKGPALLMVGDNPGGRERVTVEPLSGRGKTRVAKGGNLVAMAGGGSITSVPDGMTVTNSMTNEGGAMMAVLSAIRNMPPSEISVKEVTKAQRRIRVKENISRL